MRYPFQGTTKDGNGRVIQSGTVTVYLAGVSTLASIYAASSGGAAVNSVATDNLGNFIFWVDDIDYHYTQRFDIVISSSSHIPKTYLNIEVPGRSPFIDAERYSTFTAAVAAAANKTLRFSSSITLSANTVIPATVSLEPINPGILVSGGFTLAINGSVVGNPMHQWLSGFAAGEVVFGSNVSEVNAAWIGTDEVAINVFITALEYGGKIVKRAAIESINAGIALDNRLITLEGTSLAYQGCTDGTIIKKAVNIAIGISVIAEHCTLENFKLDCDNKTGDGIVIQNCQATIKDVYVTNVGGTGIGIKLDQSSTTHLKRARATDCYQGLVIGGGTGSQIVNIDDYQYNIDTPGSRSDGMTVSNTTAGAYRMLTFDTDPTGKAIVLAGNNTGLQFCSVYVENAGTHSVDSINVEGSGNKNISFDGLYINHGVNNLRNMVSVGDGTRGLFITNAHFLTGAATPITCVYVSTDAQVTLRNITSSGGVSYYLLDSANNPTYTTGINIDGHIAVGFKASIRLYGFNHSVRNCKNTAVLLNSVHDVIVENMDNISNIEIGGGAYDITLINCKGTITIDAGAVNIVCINCTGSITGTGANAAIKIQGQGAANADTSLTFTGADTVAKADVVLLQTEVNELKAVLRTFGFIAT